MQIFSSAFTHCLSKPLQSAFAGCTLLILLSGCKEEPSPTPGPETASALGSPDRSADEGPFSMRGLGEVSARGSVWKLDDGSEVSLVTFQTESSNKAAVLASKYITDLEGYSVSSVEDTDHPWNGRTLQVQDAGTWIIGIDGDRVQVLSGKDRVALELAGDALGAANWSVPERNLHPEYLDNFDNKAFAIWWVGGYKSPEVLEWGKDRSAIMNAWHRDSMSESYAPGVVNLSGWETLLAHGEQMDRPHRVMLYAMYGPKWWLRSVDTSEHFEKGGEGVMPGRTIFEADLYQAAQSSSPEARTILSEAMYQIMDTMSGDRAMAWKVPPGEWDIKDPAWVPPNARENYTRYLQETKGYTLEQANQLHGADAGSWDEFPYPETAWFFGRRGEFVDLDNAWRWLAHTNREAGIEQDMDQPDFDDSDWLVAPHDSLRLASIYQLPDGVAPLWGRTTINVPESLLASCKPVYLYAMPYTQREGRPFHAWINGKEITGKELSPSHENRCTVFDISDAVRAGENAVAIYSHGGRIKGRVWITHTPPQSYPFTEHTVTQRWLDWMNFLHDTKLENVEYWLKAIRAKEADRPIKQMTGWMMQSDAQDLFERYGGYLQLTGQGSFYRPMHYKGYSRLRGLPTSSEGGSPARDAATIQYHAATMFWEGQDAHDYVFDIERDLFPRKDVIEWWEQNETLLSTLGNTDFPHDDSIGLLRDVDQDWLYLGQAIWNWDLSRGPLPQAGICPVLVDGRDMDKGYAANIPVLIDTSTLIMTDKRLQAILDYVKAGGTFVAGFDTGRHGELDQNIWPLAQALGLRIEEKSVHPNDARQSPVLPLTFSEDQDLMPSLRGKTIEGMGISIDWEGNQSSGAIAIHEVDSANIKPVARWDDDSIAICEIPLGKGRIVYVGSPFYYRARDVSGRWLNDSERQALFEEFIESLGVKVPSSSTDERLWISHRESKNGLYDVYFAAPMNQSRNGYNHLEEIVASITLHDAPAGRDTAFEMTDPNHPEITGTRSEGSLTFSDLVFRPFLVRQLAIVRDDVGLTGPLHWLRVQSRTWRALDLSEVDPDLAADIQSDAAAVAQRLGQDGISLSGDWKVRRSADDLPSDGWIARDFDDADWENGTLGTWLARKWTDTRSAQYRRTVDIPAQWTADNRRIFLVHRDIAVSMARTGVRKSGRLWVNGKLVASPIEEYEYIDVTEAASQGTLDLALEVNGTPEEGGPGGSFFLWSLPTPTETLSLHGAWRKALDWAVEEGEVTLPGRVDRSENALGIRHSFELPSGWEGKPVRLVIEHANPRGDNRVEGVLLNHRGYFRESAEELATYGVRVDHWLQPGLNEIDLYNPRHSGRADRGTLNTEITDIRLERYE